MVRRETMSISCTSITKHINTVDLVADAFKDDLEVVGGALADECSTLYYRPDANPLEQEQINT
jgi:tRNA(adenine34) deaminase